MSAPAEWTLPKLLDRLERTRREAGDAPLAVAFDADGTLWSGDVGIDGFSALIGGREVRAAAAVALQDEAEAAGIPVAGDPNDQARLLLDAFNDHKLESSRAFAMMAWAFAGRTEAEMDAFASRVVRARDVRGRRFEQMAGIVEWARRRGVRTIVVSASPIAMVAAGLREAELPVDTLLAMSPEISDGVLAPAVRTPSPYGAGKPVVLAAALGASSLLAAFGDSASDLPMLRKARHPVAVWPSPALLADTLPLDLVLLHPR